MRGPKRWLLAWAAMLGSLCAWIYWPGLDMGFMADDLFQVSMVEGLFGEYPSYHLYAFAPLDAESTAAHITRGSLPWWTHPQFRFEMLRPLSSLLLSLDHWLWPRQPFAHHLHSLVWFAAVLCLGFALLRRATGVAVAAAAITVFACDETMTWMVVWLANRCAMVATVFAMLAILARQRSLDREQAAGLPGSRAVWRSLLARDRVFELVLWLLAFGAGEYAVGGVAYLAAFELLRRGGCWRSRLLGIWPALVALGVFASVYIAIHAGVYGATSYIDPLEDPARYFDELRHRLPRMLCEVWLDFPGETRRFRDLTADIGLADLVMPKNGMTPSDEIWRHVWFSLGTTFAALAPAWLLARRFLHDHERRAMHWLALGSLLSMLPLAAIPPSTRALLLPNFGASLFLGLLVVAMFRAWSERVGRLPQRLGLSFVVAVFVGQRGYRESAHAEHAVRALVNVSHAYEQFYRNFEFVPEGLSERHVVVVAAPGLVTGIHGMSMMNVLGYDPPKSWHVLAMGNRPYTLRRLDEHTLELGSVGGPMHISAGEALFRTPADSLVTGDRVDAGVFMAKVLRDHEGIGPQSILFRFSMDLDDPRLLLLEVGPHGLRRLVLPEPGRMIAIKPPVLPFEDEP